MSIQKVFLLCFLVASSASAKIKTNSVEYKNGDTAMVGYVAYKESKKASPAVLIVHDWMGLGEFQKNIANKLARMGYVALAADIYGKGVRPANTDEASKLATKFKDDRKLLRANARAAYDTLVAMKQVDPNKIVVIGYCFGGTTALELARSGALLAGTVSFHGGLSTPNTSDAKNIKGKVLVLHGADDPWVPATEVNAFKEEMKSGNVSMEFIAYEGAVHAFTNPAAGSDNSKGAAYNAKADKQSWKAFQKFLKKVL